jgi:hypothetical protein
MPSVSCGFVSTNGHQAQDSLVGYGPTILVDVGFDPNYDPNKPAALPTTLIQQVHAVIDTGATISCIDASLATRLGLPVVDRSNFGGISGNYLASVHP